MKIEKRHINKIEIGSTGLLPLSITTYEVGKRSGPDLTIVCGMHGKEYTSLHIIVKLLEQISEKDLVGSLRVVLNANPLGQALATREIPMDNADLNRIFPGNPTAEISKRTAHAVYDYCADTDFLVDLHTFSDPSIPMAIYMNSGSDEVRSQSLDMIRASGISDVWKLNYVAPEELGMHGSLCTVLSAKNTPNYAIELDEENLVSAENIDLVVKCLINTMRHCGVLEGVISDLPKVRTMDRETIRSDVTGIYSSSAQLGKQVKRGEVIGTLTSLPDLKTIEIESPYDGLLIINKTRGFVSTGDRLFCVGTNLTKE